MKQQRAAVGAKRQIAQFVEHDDVGVGEALRQGALLAGSLFQFKLIDQVHHAIEAYALARLHRVRGDGDGEMRLAGARAAHQHDVARLGGELSGVELTDLLLVDWRFGELEAIQVSIDGELGGAHLVAHRARLALGILGLQQPGEHIERGARALDTLVDHFVEGGRHPVQAQGLEPSHHLKPVHGSPPSTAAV